MTQQASKSSKAGASAPAEPKGLKLDDAGEPPANQVVTLTADALFDLLVDAQRAGASEEDLANLKRYLRREGLTLEAVNGVRQQLAELAEAREKLCKRFWLKPGHRIMVRSKVYGPGDEIRLTEEEAKDYEGALTTKAPPKPQPEVSKRKAGKYRVKGPGSVKHLRQFHAPGAVLDLDAEQAKDLGDAVEYIHPDDEKAA